MVAVLGTSPGVGVSRLCTALAHHFDPSAAISFPTGRSTLATTAKEIWITERVLKSSSSEKSIAIVDIYSQNIRSLGHDWVASQLVAAIADITIVVAEDTYGYDDLDRLALLSRAVSANNNSCRQRHLIICLRTGRRVEDSEGHELSVEDWLKWRLAPGKHNDGLDETRKRMLTTFSTISYCRIAQAISNDDIEFARNLRSLIETKLLSATTMNGRTAEQFMKEVQSAVKFTNQMGIIQQLPYRHLSARVQLTSEVLSIIEMLCQKYNSDFRNYGLETEVFHIRSEMVRLELIEQLRKRIPAGSPIEVATRTLGERLATLERTHLIACLERMENSTKRLQKTIDAVYVVCHRHRFPLNCSFEMLDNSDLSAEEKGIALDEIEVTMVQLGRSRQLAHVLSSQQIVTILVEMLAFSRRQLNNGGESVKVKLIEAADDLLVALSKEFNITGDDFDEARKVVRDTLTVESAPPAIPIPPLPVATAKRRNFISRVFTPVLSVVASVLLAGPIGLAYAPLGLTGVTYSMAVAATTNMLAGVISGQDPDDLIEGAAFAGLRGAMANYLGDVMPAISSTEKTVKAAAEGLAGGFVAEFQEGGEFAHGFASSVTGDLVAGLTENREGITRAVVTSLASAFSRGITGGDPIQGAIDGMLISFLNHDQHMDKEKLAQQRGE